MYEVAIVCSDCGEDSQQVVADIDDIDQAACPCGYSYVVRSIASREAVFSSSKKKLLTSKGGTVHLDGSITWHDPQGRLHRANGPARIVPRGGKEWFRHGVLHRRGGPAVIHPDGRRVWFSQGEKLGEEAGTPRPSLSEPRRK